MKPLVYLAGPYALPDPVLNTHKMIKAATEMCEEGLCVPLVPHLTLLWHMVTPRPLNFWLELDLEQLKHCDALMRFPGKSTGADAEVAFALSYQMPVFYVGLDDHAFKVWAKHYINDPSV